MQKGVIITPLGVLCDLFRANAIDIEQKVCKMPLERKNVKKQCNFSGKSIAFKNKHYIFAAVKVSLAYQNAIP